MYGGALLGLHNLLTNHIHAVASCSHTANKYCAINIYSPTHLFHHVMLTMEHKLVFGMRQDFVAKVPESVNSPCVMRDYACGM